MEHHHHSYVPSCSVSSRSFMYLELKWRPPICTGIQLRYRWMTWFPSFYCYSIDFLMLMMVNDHVKIHFSSIKPPWTERPSVSCWETDHLSIKPGPVLQRLPQTTWCCPLVILDRLTLLPSVENASRPEQEEIFSRKVLPDVKYL